MKKHKDDIVGLHLASVLLNSRQSKQPIRRSVYAMITNENFKVFLDEHGKTHANKSC